LLVHTGRPFDRDRVVRSVTRNEKAQERKHQGRTVYTSNSSPVAVCVLNDRDFLVGGEKDVIALLNRVDARATPRPLTAAAAVAAGQHHVVAGAVPADIALSLYSVGRPDPEGVAPPPPPPPKDKDGRRDPDKGLPVAYRPPAPPNPPQPSLEDIAARMPVQMLPYKPLLFAQTMTVTLDVGLESRLTWKTPFASEEAAREGENACRTLLYVVREALPLAVSDRLGHGVHGLPPLQPLLKPFQDGFRRATVERKGQVVEGEVKVKIDLATVKALVAELEKQGPRLQAEHNLKQIGLAAHNYHDAYGFFPGNVCDANGKPLLSWRVELLPYLEQGQLYNELKRDEPWNSPHNMKLLERLPPVYAPVEGKAAKNATFIRAFSGEGAVFGGPKQRVNLARITNLNGSSNTLMVVVAGEAVPWTEPDEFVFDPKRPPKLGGDFPEGFHAVMCDGAVRFFRKELPPEVLGHMVNYKNITPFSFDKWEIGRGGRP
jgi:hypothetical protein